MPSNTKIEYAKQLQQKIVVRPQFFLVSYKNLSVSEATDLRAQLRQHEVYVKVIKNRLFYRVLQDSDEHKQIAEEMRLQLKGPLIAAFTIEKNFSKASKIFLDFGAKTKKVALKVGYLSGEVLGAEQLESIAKLPSQDELLGVIARGMLTPATKLAMGMKEVLRCVAVGIKLQSKQHKN